MEIIVKINALANIIDKFSSRNGMNLRIHEGEKQIISIQMQHRLDQINSAYRNCTDQRSLKLTAGIAFRESLKTDFATDLYLSVQIPKWLNDNQDDALFLDSVNIIFDQVFFVNFLKINEVNKK